MLWKCTVLHLLGNRIAQKSIANAWYKFTADLSGLDRRPALQGIDRQSLAQQGGSLPLARQCPSMLELSLEFRISLACRYPAYFSINTVKEKKLGAFKTMPSWVTMICLCFYFSLWSKNVVVSSQNILPVCPSKHWVMVAMGTGL